MKTCTYSGCNRPARFSLVGLWRNAPVTHACEKCAPSWAHEAGDGDTCGAYRLQILDSEGHEADR